MAMTPRLPLFTKVLFLAFVNLFLLGLVFTLFARLQFRLDAGSFLLAPAQNRIMAVAHALALELEEAPPSTWDQVLARYTDAHGVSLFLVESRTARSWSRPSG